MAVIPTPTTHLARLASRSESSPSPECTTAVPGKYGRVDDYSACNAYYTYDPSFAAAVLFTVLFGILTISHTTQAFWYKKRFIWVVITGALFELTSFVCRTLGSRNQQNVGLATASQLLFLLAPLWINAFVYMTFGRLVHFFHPDRRCAGLKAPSIAKYFVWADIASFLVQGAGGSMLNPGNGADAQKIGLKVYMAGVGVQEGFIVRIIFRLVEFTKGFEPGNPMLFNEAYVYCLDASPMCLALLLLSVIHPGRVLVGPESEFPQLSRKEKKTMEQEKKALRREKKEEKRKYVKRQLFHLSSVKM
ncbi:hypothetical protein N0V91_008172 [Didymella pomorum]|uniref:Uncharacterized protein n=1 Tax=Didymella pomorum TaxID=749634 RepID=A0A9W8Z9P5_9PLEO|nr:hypothetical protein N0V91_008172 [Didymella pomorum]